LPLISALNNYAVFPKVSTKGARSASRPPNAFADRAERKVIADRVDENYVMRADLSSSVD